MANIIYTWVHQTTTGGIAYAVSADWSTGWSPGPPTPGSSVGMFADVVHPYVVTVSQGLATAGTLSIGGSGTLAVTGGLVTIDTVYFGDTTNELQISGGVAEFGTANVAGLTQSAGHLIFDGTGTSEINGNFAFSGGTISVAGGTLEVNADSNYAVLGTGTYTLAGTIDGTGTFRIGSARAYILAAGFDLATAAFAFDDTDQGTSAGQNGHLILAADQSYGGTVLADSGNVTVDLAGHTFAFANLGGLAAKVISSTGGGILNADGTFNGNITTDLYSLVEVGDSLAVSGTLVANDSFRIDTFGTVTLNASARVAGTLILLGQIALAQGADGPTFLVGTGTATVGSNETWTLQGIGSSGFSGTIAGAGTLMIGGEVNGTMGTGGLLSVASTTLEGTLTVADTMTDTGAFALSSGLLYVDGQMTVDGEVSFVEDSELAGTGTLVANTRFTTDQMIIGGGVLLVNDGSGSIAYSLLLGDDTGAADIINGGAGTLNVENAQIDNDNEILPTTTLFNDGVLLAAGGTISTDVVNTGSIVGVAEIGSIELLGTYTDTTETGGLYGTGTVFFGDTAKFDLMGTSTVGLQVVLGGTLALVSDTTDESFARALVIKNNLTMQPGAYVDLGASNLTVELAAQLRGHVTGNGRPVGGNYVLDRMVVGTSDIIGGFTVDGYASLVLASDKLDSDIVIGDSADADSVLEVAPGGQMTMDAGAKIDGMSNGGTDDTGAVLAPFDNNGQVDVNAGGGTASIETLMQNNGLIDLNAGYLDVEDSVGEASTPSGGPLRLSIGLATSSAGGTFDVAGGSLEFGGAVAAGQVIEFTDSGDTMKVDDPGAFAGSILIEAGDSVEFVGLNPTGWSFLGNLLTFPDATGGSESDHLTLEPDTHVTVQSDGLGDALLLGEAGAASCFAEGARLATREGDVPVERLTAGMDMRLATGGFAPVVWLGHRNVDCRRHPAPARVWPVRVRAHAFGQDHPARDLLLSPDHALWLDGALVPASRLLDGRWLVQEPVDRVTYWHVELPRHAVLLAEGLPCESFLDTGQRAGFGNGGAAVQLHPDFAQRSWDAEACAPLLLAGPRLDRLRAALRHRPPPTAWAPHHHSRSRAILGTPSDR